MPNVNKNLNQAKKKKNDEFFTKPQDVKNELDNYKRYFENKIIYLPSDEPITGQDAFWSYFAANINELKFKKLIATHLQEPISYKIQLENGVITKENLTGNGDFRSPECVNILQESDIVITNPPFSLIRELIDLIMLYNKHLLLVAPINCFKYKNVFPYIKENKLWIGYNKIKSFNTLEGGTKEFGNVSWITNLPTNREFKFLECTKKYDPTLYPKFDNYNAINVDRVKNIPIDYDDIMAVPTSFIEKHNPKQFEIIGEANHGSDNIYDLCKPIVNGKEIYPRILIKWIK